MKYAGLGSRFVQMKWLRIELRRKRLDSAGFHAMGPGSETLTYPQIFQIQKPRRLVRLTHRASFIMVDACDYGLDASCQGGLIVAAGRAPCSGRHRRGRL